MFEKSLYLLRCMLVIYVGISGGMLVAGGLFALLVKVGVITRMIARTKTAKYVDWYEDVLILGAVFANLATIFAWQLPGGYLIPVFYGVFSGVFAGCISLSLAEAVNTFPIMMRRLKMRQGLSWMVLSFALGKMVGSFCQLFS